MQHCACRYIAMMVTSVLHTRHLGHHYSSASCLAAGAVLVAVG